MSTPTSREVRHPDCGWRVRNTPDDLEAHLELCPALLLTKIQELRQSVIFLGKELDGARADIRALGGTTTTDDVSEDWDAAVTEAGLNDDPELDDPETADDPDSDPDTVGDALAAFTPTVPAPTISPIA